MPTAWSAYLERAKREHGDKLDLSAINTAFLPYFQTGTRIKVRVWGEDKTGTVSVTTGWRPSLLLIRRSNSRGSSVLLDHNAEIVAVQQGREYVPVVAS